MVPAPRPDGGLTLTLPLTLALPLALPLPLALALDIALALMVACHRHVLTLLVRDIVRS